MLSIGMIGAGWVTQHNLDAYRQLSEHVQVAAIADPIAEARERRAQFATFEPAINHLIDPGGSHNPKVTGSILEKTTHVI